MSQTTPKGVDPREYPTPSRYEGLDPKEGWKTLKYHHTLHLVGPGIATKITDEIRSKINDNKSVVICITGPPGQGKTYFGMRFGQKLDANFNISDLPPPPPNEDKGQVTFSREHLAYLTGEHSPLKRGQVILTDESHWGIGARSWQNRDQQEIVNYLAAIRSKGYVLIIVVLHTRMIDALLRDFVVNYEFHVTRRGEATVYRRWFPVHANEAYKKRLGVLKLQLPDEELCNHESCLRGRTGCRYLTKPEGKRCMTLRAIYERRKKHFLDEKGRKDEEQHQATNYTPVEEVVKFAIAHQENIPRSAFNRITKELTIHWLKELNFKIRFRDEGPIYALIKREIRKTPNKA